MVTVLLKHYKTPPIDKEEILRYAGMKQATPEIDALISDCLLEAGPALSYRVCYGEFPVSICGDTVNLSFTKTTSCDLAKNLAGCKSIVLFAATVGIGIDRLVSRYERLSPSRALILTAIGAERIEALCNCFNNEVKKEKEAFGLYTRPRFSPGYGDLSLEIQTHILSVLDCNRKIGLNLNNSLLMSPTKSVTALIGVGACHTKSNADRSCLLCKKTDCEFRRTV